MVHSPFYASHPCPFSLFWLERKALFWCLFFVSVQRTKAAPSWSRNSEEAFTCMVLLPSCVSTSTHRALCPSFQLYFFYEVTLQLNQLSNTANAPAVQAPAQERRKEWQSRGVERKAAPAAAAEPKISTGQPARLSPAQLSSGVCQSPHSPWGAHPLPLCLRLLKGQQKATRTAKDRLVTSPPLLQSLENNHHIPKVGITKACRKHLPFPREKGEHYQRAESGDGINESSSAV